MCTSAPEICVLRVLSEYLFICPISFLKGSQSGSPAASHSFNSHCTRFWSVSELSEFRNALEDRRSKCVRSPKSAYFRARNMLTRAIVSLLTSESPEIAYFRVRIPNVLIGSAQTSLLPPKAQPRSVRRVLANKPFYRGRGLLCSYMFIRVHIMLCTDAYAGVRRFRANMSRNGSV
jgi:hypothetical protein